MRESHTNSHHIAGIEDLARARQDKVENTRDVDIVTFNGDEEIITKKKNWEVKAGDIIKLTGRTSVPAGRIHNYSIRI